MLDFTSSLYLGFEHPASDVPAWPRLTLGKPAALEELPGIPRLERELASLAGCERALVAPSTLHLFWDLFAVLAGRNASIFLDDGAYPIARWGVERMAASGVPVRLFPRHNVQALRRALRDGAGRKPLIVADGFCPACGTAAPLPEYADCAAAADGLLVVDDTQALGIFGPPAADCSPYGKDGGGSLRKFGLRSPGIVVVSSLAKAFGVPMAMLGGSAALIEKFREKSKTRVHCSPPSAAVIGAACNALEMNRRMGDTLRSRLGERVARFRRGLKSRGVLASRGLFPVQPLLLPPEMDARAFYRELLDRGIAPVLQRDARGDGAQCTFVFTARHRLSDVERALEALLHLLQWRSQSKREGDKYYGTP